MNIFWGSSQKWTIFSGHFYAFFWVAKISNIFSGSLKFLIFFGGERQMLGPSLRMQKKMRVPPLGFKILNHFCCARFFAVFCSNLYLCITLNINMILAFIINIISQLIEHLNISPAFIVRSKTKKHVVLYIAIDEYTTIMKIGLSFACVAQWVEHVNIAQLLSSTSLVRIPYATFIIVKNVVFIYFLFFCKL